MGDEKIGLRLLLIPSAGGWQGIVEETVPNLPKDLGGAPIAPWHAGSPLGRGRPGFRHPAEPESRRAFIGARAPPGPSFKLGDNLVAMVGKVRGV